MLVAMHILNPVLMVLVPLAIAARLVRSYRLDWAIFGLGAGTFIASQIFHIPFNHFVLNPVLLNMGPGAGAGVAGAVLLGLSAGLFEEMARYLMLKRQAGRIHSWPQGLLVGLGHGGTEAIIVGLIVFYGLFQAMALQGVPLEGVVPPDRLGVVRAQLEAFWGLAWYEPLWGALERFSALAFHTMAATLVLLAIQRRRASWLLVAVLAHTLFNTVALVAIKAIGVAGTELILAGIGGLCLWLTWRMRPLFVGESEFIGDQPGPGISSGVRVDEGEIEVERLDESKFV
jgi:uncharacterized membrane protein YhfC